MQAQPETAEPLQTIDRAIFKSFLRTLDEDSNKKISSSCVVYERKECPHQDKMVPLCGACDLATTDQREIIKQLTQGGFEMFSFTSILYQSPVSLVSEFKRKDRIVNVEHHSSRIIFRNMR